MKNPLIFGLSDPDNVATGTVPGGGTTLTLDDGGQPANSKTVSLKTLPLESLNFADGTIADDSNPPVLGDFDISIHFELRNGVGIQDLGVKSLSQVTAAPTSGYIPHPDASMFNMGHCYAFDLGGGKYAAIELVSQTGTGGSTVTTLKYKIFF